MLSFLVAGISALLSALCYSEFAAEFPLAGGAYNYISMSLVGVGCFVVPMARRLPPNRSQTHLVY